MGSQPSGLSQPARNGAVGSGSSAAHGASGRIGECLVMQGKFSQTRPSRGECGSRPGLTSAQKRRRQETDSHAMSIAEVAENPGTYAEIQDLARSSNPICREGMQPNAG